MEHRILLTYCCEGRDTYAWFESAEEMDEFINSNPDISVSEKLEIVKANTLG